jgi:hypothetical protein
MERRNFLKQSSTLGMGVLSTSFLDLSFFEGKNNPVILIVSGWQDVNIGDIAHTPGLLHLFETYLPDARIILWKRSRSEEVRKLLVKNFPKVSIIYGEVNTSKDTDSLDVLNAFKEADLMVHGSGPSLVGADNLACWSKNTSKPYGVFGVTLEDPNEYHKEILRKASFIFTRETLSIEHLKKAGIEGSHIRFAPDATFFMNIHDEVRAKTFLKENGLESKKFICVIPRLRYTPYHLFNPNRNGWSEDRIKMVEETNLKYKETDHAKLREAMIAWVRHTGNKVLVCPEMTYQVDIMDELLISPLPDDVRASVKKRGYWFPDEAASVYAEAYAVLSFECHTPIIAAVNNTPMFYLRQPEDTIKGQMYYDLDFNDWVFEINNTTGIQITERLMNIYNDYPGALNYLKKSMHLVDIRYDDGFKTIKDRVTF